MMNRSSGDKAEQAKGDAVHAAAVEVGEGEIAGTTPNTIGSSSNRMEIPAELLPKDPDDLLNFLLLLVHPSSCDRAMHFLRSWRQNVLASSGCFCRLLTPEVTPQSDNDGVIGVYFSSPTKLTSSNEVKTGSWIIEEGKREEGCGVMSCREVSLHSHQTSQPSKRCRSSTDSLSEPTIKTGMIINRDKFVEHILLQDPFFCRVAHRVVRPQARFSSLFEVAQFLVQEVPRGRETLMGATPLDAEKTVIRLSCFPKKHLEKVFDIVEEIQQQKYKEQQGVIEFHPCDFNSIVHVIEVTDSVYFVECQHLLDDEDKGTSANSEADGDKDEQEKRKKIRKNAVYDLLGHFSRSALPQNLVCRAQLKLHEGIFRLWERMVALSSGDTATNKNNNIKMCGSNEMDREFEELKHHWLLQYAANKSTSEGTATGADHRDLVALDIGASPGGWSYELVHTMGCTEVIAVDAGSMSFQHPNVNHVKELLLPQEKKDEKEKKPAEETVEERHKVGNIIGSNQSKVSGASSPEGLSSTIEIVNNRIFDVIVSDINQSPDVLVSILKCVRLMNDRRHSGVGVKGDDNKAVSQSYGGGGGGILILTFKKCCPTQRRWKEIKARCAEELVKMFQLRDHFILQLFANTPNECTFFGIA